MQVWTRPITVLLGNREMKFVIPVYQRNYDWKMSNCKTLFDDIRKIATTDETHFIGSVCYKAPNLRECVIIDGQQRITSLMLLLKAVIDTASDSEIKMIKNWYLEYHSFGVGTKIKLIPIKRDREIFNKIINIEEFCESDFTDSEKRTNVYRNYKLFYDLLIETYNSGINERQILDAISRLEIVELQLDKENPQVIFESLNSTGLDLTNVDLLRNYLLMPLDYQRQEELYEKYWSKIEDNVGTEKMEDFMTHYLLLKEKTNSFIVNGKKQAITSTTLYEMFKLYINKMKKSSDEYSIDMLFDDMLQKSKYYKQFISLSLETCKNKRDRQIYELIQILDVKDVTILLMDLFDKFHRGTISEETLNKCVDISLSFAFRGTICDRNAFNKQFTALLIPKLDIECADNKFVKLFLDAITSGKGKFSFPKDAEFKQMIQTKDLYTTLKSDRCKYLLHKLEEFENPNEQVQYTDGTIEHIMPRTLSYDWKKYLQTYKMSIEEHEAVLHRLGNLTLTGHNSKLSNDMFKQKQEIYKKSNYYNTRQLSIYDKWTNQEIADRGARLAEIACKIWSLPNEYNENTINVGVLYGLDAEFDRFYGSKPESIIILDETILVNSWRDVLIISLEKLCEIDTPTFNAMVECNMKYNNHKYLSTDENAFQYAHKLNCGVFVNVNKSAVDILRAIKDFARFFDDKLHASISEEFYYTLKKA